MTKFQTMIFLIKFAYKYAHMNSEQRFSVSWNLWDDTHFYVGEDLALTQLQQKICGLIDRHLIAHREYSPRGW